MRGGSPPPHYSRTLISVSPAAQARTVHSIAVQKLRARLEQHVVGLGRAAGIGFRDSHGGDDGAGPRLLEQLLCACQRDAPVEHPIDQQNRPPTDQFAGRLQDHQIAGLLRTRIGAEPDEFGLQIEPMVNEGAQQVRGENKSARQNRNRNIGPQD